MTDTTTPERIAVVGSGIAGLTAAYVASRTSHVTLFEADDRLGGHADTHVVTEASAGQTRELAIDTGFIVHNPRTYPVLLRLFAELGVATQPSEMSMSIRDDGTGLQWAGALGRRGVFPTAANLRNPRYLRMLTEIPRFHRRARRLLAAAVSPARPAAVTPRFGTSWRPDGSRRTSTATSWSLSSRPCGRATRTWRSTTRRATCSRSWSTTGCSACSAVPSGGR